MRAIHRSLGLLLALAMLLTLLAPTALAAAPTSGVAADARTAAVDRALAWLRASQQADGSFAGNAGTTIEVILAIAAAGQDPATWSSTRTNLSPLDYLASQAERYAVDAATTGKLIAGIVAAGYDPRAFAGRDLVARLQRYGDGARAFSPTTLGQAWAVLALAAAREPLPSGAVEALLKAQQADGGWEGAPGWGTDSNMTALALQALVAGGGPTAAAALQPALARGQVYLAAQQSPSGGFTYSAKWGNVADADSTAYALQGLYALGQDPSSAAWRKNGAAPLDDLLRLQSASGAFEWQAGLGANLLATAQAIPALLGRTLPVPGNLPAIRSALNYLRSVQQADGSFAGGIGSNLGPSAQALMVLATVGENPRAWRGSSGASLLDYLRQAALTVKDAGTAGQLATALALAGENPRAYGNDLVAIIRRNYDPATGAYDAYQNIYNHALAMWGLSAADEAVPADAVAWLIRQQNKDGGWGWAGGQNSDTNSTAAALQALLAGGVSAQDAAVSAALTYLHVQQAADAGFGYDLALGPASDANSTANVIQALLAAGDDPALGWDWAKASPKNIRKPLDALLAFQRADGAFEWQAGAGANLLATLQALPALAKATFPRGRAQVAGSAATRPVALTNNVPLRGEFSGSRSGAFAFYAVDYPGDGRQVTLQVSFSPADPVTSGAFGFNVYGANGRILGQGASWGSDQSGLASLSLSDNQAARWLVQVYNYLPGAAVAYTIVAQGLPTNAPAAPAAQAASNTEPSDALELGTSATGNLTGNRAGAYAFFKFTYAGDGSSVTLRLSVAPDDAIIAQGVGLVVYSPTGEAFRGERQVTFASNTRGDYLVQLYNYLDGLGVRYTLTR